jgi:hypothetical protein
VRDSIELAVAALRVVDGAAAFCRPHGDAPGMTIAELARMFAAKPKRLSGADLLAADIVRRHRGPRRLAAGVDPKWGPCCVSCPLADGVAARASERPLRATGR